VRLLGWLHSGQPTSRLVPELQYQEGGGRRGHLIRGRVSSLATDTLYVAVTDSVGPLAIPQTLIQRLDLSRGVPSRGEGALRSGLISGVAWALSFALAAGISDNDDVNAGEAALIGGGVGLSIGAVFGAAYPRERWKRVP
jgi:hypothetical protein